MTAAGAVAQSQPKNRKVLLAVEGVSKAYGGVTVLDQVSVQFNAGEVHALLGENGAGKSTLVKIMAGVISHDAGEVTGEAHDTHDVAMVFQELSVIPEMSVVDNLALAGRSRGPFVPYRSLRARANEVLRSAGLADVDLNKPVATLSLAQRQLLEIARGLMVNARVLILDEPTATLSDIEITRVHAVIKELIKQGHAVVYITHRLGEVFTLADRVTIMRAGKVVASGPTSQFVMKEVVSHMLGADHVPVDKQATERTPNVGTGLAVTDLSSPGQFQQISFDAPPGTILALFGQIGSGADDVVKILAGYGGASEGSVTLDGERLRLRSRAESQQEGIAFVSADRVSEGVFLNASVTTNISSGALRDVSTGSIIRKAKEVELARAQAGYVSFNPGRIRENVSAFSGGNQQKVAVARALATRPRVLVLNEPTRGVDIGARSEIYRSIRNLLAEKMIVVVYSSDIVEIRELADLVVTMYRGQLVGKHEVDDIDDSALITEILHGATR